MQLTGDENVREQKRFEVARRTVDSLFDKLNKPVPFGGSSLPDEILFPALRDPQRARVMAHLAEAPSRPLSIAAKVFPGLMGVIADQRITDVEAVLRGDRLRADAIDAARADAGRMLPVSKGPDPLTYRPPKEGRPIRSLKQVLGRAALDAAMDVPKSVAGAVANLTNRTEKGPKVGGVIRDAVNPRVWKQIGLADAPAMGAMYLSELKEAAKSLVRPTTKFESQVMNAMSGKLANMPNVMDTGLTTDARFKSAQDALDLRAIPGTTKNIPSPARVLLEAGHPLKPSTWGNYPAEASKAQRISRDIQHGIDAVEGGDLPKTPTSDVARVPKLQKLLKALGPIGTAASAGEGIWRLTNEDETDDTMGRALIADAIGDVAAYALAVPTLGASVALQDGPVWFDLAKDATELVTGEDELRFQEGEEDYLGGTGIFAKQIEKTVVDVLEGENPFLQDDDPGRDA